MNTNTEQGVAPYVAQGVRRPVNADVGSGKIIWATARIMDLPH